MRSNHPLRAFDHAYAFVLIVVFPLFAKFWGYPRLLEALERGDPGARTTSYAATMVIQWTLVGILVFAWHRFRRPAAALGWRRPRGWRLALAIALPVLLSVLTVVQSIALANQPALLDQPRAQLGDLVKMVPHTNQELNLFMALSLTAGVCEELLYRSFLIGYVARFMPPILAVVLCGVVFGVGHLYQGIAGATRIGILGIVLGGLYLLMGSVWPLMALHAIIDVGGGIVGFLVARAS